VVRLRNCNKHSAIWLLYTTHKHKFMWFWQVSKFSQNTPVLIGSAIISDDTSVPVVIPRRLPAFLRWSSTVGTLASKDTHRSLSFPCNSYFSNFDVSLRLFTSYQVSNFSATLLESLRFDPVYNLAGINPGLARKGRVAIFRTYRIQLKFLGEYLQNCKGGIELVWTSWIVNFICEFERDSDFFVFF